ncbi:hypothetical protein [Xenorhabdus bovienii]|nr:hypothetical protein [Xenorhabdus bovienii]
MKNNIATMGNFFKDGSLSRMNTLQSLEVKTTFREGGFKLGPL